LNSLISFFSHTPYSSVVYSMGIIIFFSVGFLIKISLFFYHFRKYKLLKRKWTENKIKTMKWDKFELLCQEYFIHKGWRTKVSNSGADGGIDIYLSKRRKKGIVQCKRYKTTPIGVSFIREFFGVMVSSGASVGFFITSSSFTKECYSFSKDKNIKLINGRDFIKLLP